MEMNQKECGIVCKDNGTEQIENATSAIIATLLAGAKGEDARKTLDRVHIPGRMEIIKTI